MPFTLLLALLIVSVTAEEKDSALPRLGDVSAVESFTDSSEVVVIGFFEGGDSFGYKEFVTAVSELNDIPAALCHEKAVWPHFNVASDTISIFRKADLHQENLLLSKAQGLDVDGLTRFFSINKLRYVTEYNQVTAVGLFKSKVKTHLLLLANRGSRDFDDLKDRMAALAPEYSGKFLFVLVDGTLKSNVRSLGYFGLKPKQLPRLGIYNQDLDRSWLLPPGEITPERLREFCDSFLQGELQKQTEQEKKPNSKTEL
ncbi:endoplasmic reticulum resident protein 27 isoform X2 [Brienomyrus brachyistius]|uniref:endoplasmic reticulum resident protein 27 isoform X2 n=1 Tax=Brienomyrus brachyistius TaxID=42636 RepID=UPI0020B279A6|nr:endoplasmic reticulum resident protein 27 isoform X2 [Brienomyrus brachyistius]